MADIWHKILKVIKRGLSQIEFQEMARLITYLCV